MRSRCHRDAILRGTMTSSRLAQDRDDPLITLDWKGPFSVTTDGLEARNPQADADTLRAMLGQAGVYYVLLDHLVHGPRALTYIGRSDCLERRLGQHKWLVQEWDVEVYVALAPLDRLSDVEELLIWAHSPCVNANSVAGSSVP